MEPTEHTAAEIRRWTPTDGAQAVFRSARDSAGWDEYTLSRPECMDGKAGFHRVDTSGNFSVDFVTAAP
ncbi:MAG: hypothetical protein CVT64_02565 [Actinobacteria bacterium HGW-Actinobacteria-4]|nr:MAG: hypothetical protein CVT64_02565 [Actinobacteria bacterium HGW-Actinobacteria-4]